VGAVAAAAVRRAPGHVERVRKPEPEVFRRVLEHHGVPAERTFFADDMPENVAGARSVGITAVLVEHDTDLRDAVRTFVAAHADTHAPLA
jgi:FMN phosphatase YigB (HAD superfamily)